MATSLVALALFVAVAPGYYESSFEQRMKKNGCETEILTGFSFAGGNTTACGFRVGFGYKQCFQLDWVLSDQTDPSRFYTYCASTASNRTKVISATDVLSCAQSFMGVIERDVSSIVTPPTENEDGSITIFLDPSIDVRVRQETTAVGDEYFIQKCFTNAERGGIIFGIFVASFFAALLLLAFFLVCIALVGFEESRDESSEEDES